MIAQWYFALKLVHVGCVCISGALFVWRGGLMLAESPRLHRRWLRILPHVVDTMLLASAIGLVLMLHQYPFVHGWLTAKVLALVAYIVIGSVALKRGRTKRVRSVAFVVALLMFGYIVTVALAHDPRGLFSRLAG